MALTSLDPSAKRQPYNTIGDAIKHYRIKNGWTQIQLATRLGKSQGTIAHWEANRVTPKTKDMPRLSIELGCPVQLLINHRHAMSI
jgi:transcriptional regulator with XRE-family HTH domain